MCNLSCVLAIVHEQQLELLRIVHHKLVETCAQMSNETWLLIPCRGASRMVAAELSLIDGRAQSAGRSSNFAPEQPAWEYNSPLGSK